MARVTLEDLSEKELEVVYMAETVDEAQSVETVLTDASVDYVVEVEPYIQIGVSPLLPSSERSGASFYVLSDQVAYCKRLLSVAGLSEGFVK